MDYRTAWKERSRIDEEKKLKLFQEAKKTAKYAARILVDEFGAERVYLFGSLLDKDDFAIHSDIDIAVEGLKIELYFKALSRIWEGLPKGVSLDLVPVEDADSYIKSKILTAGVILYEKQPTHS